MSVGTALAPVFVQVALTLGLLVWSGVLRIRAVTSRSVHYRDIALGEPNWPQRATQISNAFANQLELPVLFYVAVAFALIAAGPPSTLLVVLSWLFVISRGLHALVHTTTNNVPRRFFTYVGGLVLLALIWLVVLAEVYLGL
jgi:hypothetical protein